MTLLRSWIMAITLLSSTSTFAVDVYQIDLYLMSNMTVKQKSFARDIRLNIHYVDAADVAEQALSKQLPATEDAARRKLHAILDQNPDIAKQIAKAHLPAIKASVLAIKKVPAAVINNGAGIIYGSTDITAILQAAQNKD